MLAIPIIAVSRMQATFTFYTSVLGRAPIAKLRPMLGHELFEPLRESKVPCESSTSRNRAWPS